MSEKFVFQPNLRESVAAKLAVIGPSGSGKSVGALLLAYGLCGDWRRVAFVDTEGDSGSQPAGQTFDGQRIPNEPDAACLRCALAPPYHPDRMTELVQYVEGLTEEGPDGPRPRFDVLVFDSLSHVWNGAGGTLEMVDKLKADGWKVMTPKFRRFIDSVRLSRLHVVATMRTKTEMEYVTREDPQTGKKKVAEINKLGLKPIMRDEVDYEFTTVLRLDMQRNASCDKDRTRLFADRPPAPLSVEVGRMVAEWCRGGVSEVGSDEWVAGKMELLQSYGGSVDGLATLWHGVKTHQPRIKVADWKNLVAATSASKARLTGQP